MPPPCHGGWTELVRTMPIIFFIKQAPWRTEAWSSKDAAAFRGHGATEFAKTTPVSTSSSRRHGGRRRGGSRGCHRRATVDGATDFAKMTSMSTSSTRRRKDRDRELARRTPAIHFVSWS